MEVSTPAYLTDLQQNEVEFPSMAARIKSVGRKWVAIATGYSEQYITEYMMARQGSVKLENAIIQNLPRAAELKHAAENEACIDAINDASAHVQRALTLRRNQVEELEEISHLLQHFEQAVSS